MKRSIYVLALMVLLLSSCSINDRIERREDRLVGRWVFDNAWYKDNGALFRDNIYDEYAGDIIEFFYDYEAAYDDYSEQFVYWGEWEIFAERDRGSEDDIDFFLDMYFYNERGRVAFSYVGEVRRLTYNRFTLRAYDRFGEYTFKLRKID